MIFFFFFQGPQDEHQAPEGLQNGQGAGAITGTGTATDPASIMSWRGSVTARGRRGTAGTEIGREGTEGTRRDGGPAVQKRTKTDENVEEVAAAVGNEGANAKTRRGMAGRTKVGGRTRITTRTEALTGRGRGIRRAGGRRMTGDTKMTGRGTEKKERWSGWAGVEAERGSTKVAEQTLERRRRSAVTAKRGTETESSDLTNIVIAKRRAIISKSPVMTAVDTNGEGVRALSKCHLKAICLLCFSLLFLPSHWGCHLC